MTRARTSRNRATRSTLTCYLQHIANSTGANFGEPSAETQHRHGPCRDGRHACPTPAICTGTKWAHPTHTYSRTRTETGLSSPLPHPDRDLAATLPRHICAGADGRALAPPMRLRGDCARRLLPRQARAARPDCGRHPLTGSLRGTAVLGPHSRALALRSLRCVLCGGRTHGVLTGY